MNIKSKTCSKSAQVAVAILITVVTLLLLNTEKLVSAVLTVYM